MPEVFIPDELFTRLAADAEQSHGGDIVAFVRSTLTAIEKRPADLSIPDDLLSELSAEAKRSHEGDVIALMRSTLTQWTQLATSNQLLDKHPAVPGEKPAAHVARVFAEVDWLSIDTLGRMAATLTEVSGSVAAARTGSAAGYLTPYLAWVAGDPVNRALGCHLVSQQATSGAQGAQAQSVVSVANGFLQGNGTTVTGTLRQLFSDRRADGGGPFPTARQDDLGVEITVAPDGSGYTEVTLVAVTWGGGRQTLRDTHERAGVLVGTGGAIAGLAPEALYALSLSTATIPG